MNSLRRSAFTLLATAVVTASLLGQQGASDSQLETEIGPVLIDSMRQRLDDRYRAVLAELRAETPVGLNESKRRARAGALDLLSTYRELAQFGRHDVPGERRHLFVDATGRRCAVAYLLDATGGTAITDRVAANGNHTFVAALAEDGPFLAWLDRVGLTFAEAARIQAPGINTPGMAAPNPPYRRGRIATDTPREDPGKATPGGTVRTTTGGAPGIGAAAENPKTRGARVDALPAETWSEWWRWNRQVHLPHRALDQASRSRTAVDPITALRETSLQQLRPGF